MASPAPISRTEALVGAVRFALDRHRAWLDTTPLRTVHLIIVLNEHTGFPLRVLFKPESPHEITRADVDAALRGGRP